MNCRPLQHDAYHQFLHFFFSIVSLTPCLSIPELGRLGPTDHAGASPLAKTIVIAKSCVFYTIFVSIRGQAAFYHGRVFPCMWVCIKRCTGRKKANFVQLNYSRFLHWIRNRINRSSFVVVLRLWIAALFNIMPIINFFILSSLLWAWHPGLGWLGPTDHAGASPLAKTSSNCKILRFCHNIC